MIQLLSGDARDVLPTLAADSVQCVVTSPPYYGLRDYGTALWDGGDGACDHVKTVYKPASYANGRGEVGNGCSGWRGEQRNQSEPFRDTCGKCGATRIDRQIGLEATPDEYLATMVGVFREIRRVLRPDGTVWCNMGDSYNANQGSGWTPTRGHNGHASPKVNSGLAAKQLLMMPARLALALQADGWWLRSDIIIAKKNPMPESCRDRPTSAHEHVFLLTKAARYFYDIDGVREPIKDSSIARLTQPNVLNQPGGPKDSGEGNRSHRKTLRNQAERLIAAEKWTDRFEGWAEWDTTQGRNLRNVWDISTEAFKGSHFATMPTSVVERCIRAGTSERGACSQCGAPWGRVVEQTRASSWEARKAAGHVSNIGGSVALQVANGATHDFDNRAGGFGDPKMERTTGWSPGCRCGTTETRPCVVLDPFAGAGTTLLVADRLQRDAIGIELSPDYTRLAMQRCQDDAPLFTSFPPASDDTYDSGMRDLFRDAAD